jgi:hypothetical protein
VYWLIKSLFKDFAPGDPQEDTNMYDVLFYTQADNFLYAPFTAPNEGGWVNRSRILKGCSGHPKDILEKAAHSLFSKFPGARPRYFELLGDNFEHVHEWISKVMFFFFVYITVQRCARRRSSCCTRVSEMTQVPLPSSARKM